MRKFLVRVNGEEYEVEVAEITAGSPSGDFQIGDVRKVTGTGSGQGAPLQVTTTIRAPMPGRVLSVEVGKGDQVEAGQVVLILEAMKMENEIQTESPGTVTRIMVEENDTVDAGDSLIEIEEIQS